MYQAEKRARLTVDQLPSTAQLQHTMQPASRKSAPDQILDPCFSNLDKILDEDDSVEASQDHLTLTKKAIS